CEAFEKGVSLTHCSGDAYKMYIQFLEALQIPWVIFSDYDKPGVQTKVNRIASDLGVDINNDNRFVLLNNSIEHYLIDEGYRAEFQNAYFAIKEPEYSDETRKAEERTRVESLSDVDLKNDETVKNWKSKMAPIWAQSIIEHADPALQIPQKIKELFAILDQKLQY
ncbi:MAG TPA: hypothetical protein PKD85_11620, partial [Saprospiraceae bacterium]|nr:hypothetical protein [Saprospiraceae bacterium]